MIGGGACQGCRAEYDWLDMGDGTFAPDEASARATSTLPAFEVAGREREFRAGFTAANAAFVRDSVWLDSSTPRRPVDNPAGRGGA